MPLTESRKKWIDPVKGFIFLSDAEIANFTKQELYDYRESQKDYWDMFSVVETAENKGVAKGLEQGRAEGRAEGEAIGIAKGEAIGIAKGEKNMAISIATTMLSMSMDLEQIAEATKLTIDEIKALRNK